MQKNAKSHIRRGDQSLAALSLERTIPTDACALQMECWFDSKPSHASNPRALLFRCQFCPNRAEKLAFYATSVYARPGSLPTLL